MTRRLVTLMSVVLLLSLAAFGLLMGAYQGQVMQEVARTASAVGRAALRTLERGAHGPGDQQVFVWRQSVTLPPAPGSADPAATTSGAVEVREVRRVVATHVPPDADASDPAPPGTVATRLLINVEEVSAETDRSGALVLKIPTLTPTQGGQEIRLPIEVGHYEELFRAVRRRSLALFLGVFVVGVVLSAGVASRFTRPIRRLDAGIRRLAAGELDVAVEVSGRDEIARLAQTFNEMAARLRASRDRARELARREKLSALGRLAAGVAHDVRNPLHSIGLTLQHLSDAARPEDGERALEFDRAVGIIRGEIRRLDQLVSNFLRFAKSGEREREAVALSGLVRETVRLVQQEAERRGVALELDLDEAAPLVQADPESLRAAILNLVLNGFEAMPGGGRLRLSLAAAGGERGQGGEAVLEVADTGEGIPEAQQDRVFDFAYTTRENGSGLGLAMVYHAIVEEHGGRVSLESQPGRGTRVRLSLPAAGAGAGAVS